MEQIPNFKDYEDKSSKEHSILRLIKIYFLNIMAFVGVCFLFYHFLLGQPYVCTMSEDCNYNNQITNNAVFAISNDLTDCKQQILNLTNSCDDYCYNKLKRGFKNGN